MCGRYYVNDTFEKELRLLLRELQGQFRSESISGAEAFSSPEGHDIFPGSSALILKNSGSGLEAVQMTWGFPSPKGKGLLINARAETALQKPTFSDSLLRRRCIIPASRFYEWDPSGTKVTFYREKSEMLYFAGMYRRFEDGDRFVILTTGANASMAQTHDRMPLILEKKEIPLWIEDETKLRHFLKKEMPELIHEQDYMQESLDLIT